MRRLPDWIDAYMLYTENTEPSQMFRKWTAISTIASALQRKCYVQWGISLTWYPNLYVVLVGPSSSRKGTAMSPGLTLIEDIGRIKIAAQATTLQALIRRLKETNHSDIDLETNEVQIHSSMTIYSKEFTVFLGYHNYELMAALCDWYDCDRRWTYETISRKKEEIVGVWVNLFGATTPDLIRSSMPMDAIGGGLTSRIIYIFEEAKGKTVPLPMQTLKEFELYELLLHDLEQISLLSGRFKYTEDFMNKWTEWYIASDKEKPFHDERFAGYIGRRPTHIMKLSMVIAASRNKGNNRQMVLESEDFDRALATLTEAEVKMPKVFSGVGKSSVADLIHRSLILFESSETGEIPVWQYAKQFQSDMDKMTMDRVLQTLEAMNYVKVIHRPQAEDIIKILDFKRRKAE